MKDSYASLVIKNSVISLVYWGKTDSIRLLCGVKIAKKLIQHQFLNTKQGKFQMSRDRLEDLGRLSVMIDNILENEIFSEERMMAKDFPEWFCEQCPEKRETILNRFAIGIQEVENALLNALEIAKGIDVLNESIGDG